MMSLLEDRVSANQIISELREQNNLLKLLIRATLTATQNPLVRYPRPRIIRDTDFPKEKLTIQPGARLDVLSLPESPNTDVDIAFISAQSAINSNKVRHTLTSTSDIGGRFNFNLTQQELAANGFTTPNISFPWTPLAAGVLGIFQVILSTPFPGFALHKTIKVTLTNEDSVAATIQKNGLFILTYEYDQITKDIFARVLEATSPGGPG